MTKALWIAALALAVAACTPATSTQVQPSAGRPAGVPVPPPVASPPGREPNGATAALVKQSRSQLADGRYSEAAASLERAIRIQPGDPWLWIDLANVHLDSGNVGQAESHARKALNLAGQDRAATLEAERILNAVATR